MVAMLLPAWVKLIVGRALGNAGSAPAKKSPGSPERHHAGDEQ